MPVIGTHKSLRSPTRVLKAATAMSLALVVCGCTISSGRGPMASKIVSEAGQHENSPDDYYIVDFSDAVTDVLATAPTASLSASFGTQPPPPRLVLGTGDTLDVSIFESAPGGLFSPPVDGITTGSQQINLPKQVIDQAGMIEVPYAGRIRAAGRTPAELAKVIEQSLANRAIEPQVMVSAVDTTANTATVLGDVSSTGRIRLSIAGDRILTVLANAGVHGSETETVVRLVRNGVVQTVPLTTMVNASSENVYVYPGDTIFVLKQPQIFNAMGAVSKPGQYPIGFSTQTVAGAVSLAGGLNDNVADAGGVFMFRFVPVEVARKLIPSQTQFNETSAGVPVVFRIRFSDPHSFFWLQKVPVRNEDLIYVANSVSVELQKFIGLASQISLVGLRTTQIRKALD